MCCWQQERMLMSNTRFKMEWRPLVLLMAIGGIVGRATVGQSLSNYWSTIEQLLDNYWVIFEQLLGNLWATIGQSLINYWPSSGRAHWQKQETNGKAGLLSAFMNYKLLWGTLWRVHPSKPKKSDREQTYISNHGARQTLFSYQILNRTGHSWHKTLFKIPPLGFQAGEWKMTGMWGRLLCNQTPNIISRTGITDPVVCCGISASYLETAQ